MELRPVASSMPQLHYDHHHALPSSITQGYFNENSSDYTSYYGYACGQGYATTPAAVSQGGQWPCDYNSTSGYGASTPPSLQRAPSSYLAYEDYKVMLPASAELEPYSLLPQSPSESKVLSAHDYQSHSMEPTEEGQITEQHDPATGEAVTVQYIGGVRVVKKKVTANKKERRRTLSINSAFSNLRDRIPNVPQDTKLSKIKTLRLATSYIEYLMKLLEEGDDPESEARGQKGCEGFKVDLQRFKRGSRGENKLVS